jgi:hypothetical protein
VTVDSGELFRQSERVATPDEKPSLEQRQAMMIEARARADSVARRLVGLTEEAAESLVASEHCVMRVARRDGTGWPLTADYSPSRITVVVAGGRVLDATARG